MGWSLVVLAGASLVMGDTGLSPRAAGGLMEGGVAGGLNQSSEALALVETEEWGLRGAAGCRELVGHGGARTRACSAAAVSAGLRPCAVRSFAPDSVAGSVEAARGEGSAVRATEAYAAGCRAWQVQLWAMGRAALSYGWGASSGRFYPIWRTGAAVTLVDQGLP